MGTSSKRPNVTPIRRAIQKSTNLETGEQTTNLVEEEEYVAKRKHRPKALRKQWTLVDHRALSHLRMTALQWHIFVVMLGDLDTIRNEVWLTGTEIADRIGTYQPTVHRAMRDMIERGIIAKVGNGRYSINKNLAFRGSANEWDDATDNEDMPRMEKP